MEDKGRVIDSSMALQEEDVKGSAKSCGQMEESFTPEIILRTEIILKKVELLLASMQDIIKQGLREQLVHQHGSKRVDQSGVHACSEMRRKKPKNIAKVGTQIESIAAGQRSDIKAQQRPEDRSKNVSNHQVTPRKTKESARAQMTDEQRSKKWARHAKSAERIAKRPNAAFMEQIENPFIHGGAPLWRCKNMSQKQIDAELAKVPDDHRRRFVKEFIRLSKAIPEIRNARQLQETAKPASEKAETPNEKQVQSRPPSSSSSSSSSNSESTSSSAESKDSPAAEKRTEKPSESKPTSSSSSASTCSSADNKDLAKAQKPSAKPAPSPSPSDSGVASSSTVSKDCKPPLRSCLRSRRSGSHDKSSSSRTMASCPDQDDLGEHSFMGLKKTKAIMSTSMPQGRYSSAVKRDKSDDDFISDDTDGELRHSSMPDRSRSDRISSSRFDLQHHSRHDSERSQHRSSGRNCESSRHRGSSHEGESTNSDSSRPQHGWHQSSRQLRNHPRASKDDERFDIIFGSDEDSDASDRRQHSSTHGHRDGHARSTKHGDSISGRSISGRNGGGSGGSVRNYM